jgi:hypothetical protein
MELTQDIVHRPSFIPIENHRQHSFVYSKFYVFRPRKALDELVASIAIIQSPL